MKNILAILILIIGGLAAYYFLVEEKSPLSNSQDLKDFAIEDTASIDKIFMSQPNGKKILLTREGVGTWVVNNDFPARKDAINLILKTVHDIQIMGNVANEKFDHVVKRLASGSTKVEYYTGGKTPEKTWYIGDPTVSRLGTYMLLEEDGIKSKSPYAMHLLMERGYLSSRFFLDPVLWKDRFLLKSDPKNIQSIRVTFLQDTLAAYQVNQFEQGKFELMNLETGEEKPLPTEIAVPYFKEFQAVYYEYIDLKTSKTELDSIYSSLPRHKIEVKIKGEEDLIVKTYNLPVVAGANIEGMPLKYHPERMYAYSSYMGDEVHAIVQNLTFDKLIPPINFFESSTTVEK